MIAFFRRSAPWAAAATVAVLVAAACGGTSGGGGGGATTFKGTKKVGISVALTGQSQSYGQSIRNGLMLAADDINAKGGVNGYKIDLDVLDDGTDANRTADNVRQLILQDNVVALIGPVTTAQCQAASPLSKQNKVLLIAATCNAYQLTAQPQYVNPYYVSVVPNTFMEGAAAAQLAAKTGAKRVFIVSPKYLFGTSETNAFVAGLKKFAPGTQIVNDPATWYVPFVPTGITNWSPTINAIQSLKPDLVYSNVFAADQVNFIKAALQVDPKFFDKYPTETLASVDEFKTLGSSYPIGMRLYMRAPFFALTNSRMTDFVNRYRSKYGEYPSDWAVMDYDALQVWAQAAARAGSFDSDKVHSQIVGHSFQSLRGYSFTIRAADQQANVGETVGTTVDSGGKYPFPVLKDSTNLKGDDLIMPANIVEELRSGKCDFAKEAAGIAAFTTCPSWPK